MTRQDLSGKVAIVTGGGTGIGRGLALALARQGVKVVICGRRPEPLEEVAAAIRDEGGEVLPLSANVADEADIQRLMKTTLHTFGLIDIAINNAAVGGVGYIHQHSIDVWDETIAINLRGPFLLARAVLPVMRLRRQGHIINISSESGLEYYKGNGAYGVSKHALNALGEFIQRENQQFGIRVNTICPGMVVTEMTDQSAGLNREKCLYPEDIAELVLWLLTRSPNVKIGRPVLIQTMENPWQT